MHRVSSRVNALERCPLPLDCWAEIGQQAHVVTQAMLRLVCRLFSQRIKVSEFHVSPDTWADRRLVELLRGISFDEVLPRTMRKRPMRLPLTSIMARHCSSLVQWAVTRGYRADYTACAAAARKGDLVTLNWLAKRGIIPDESTAVAAAMEGHLDVLQWCVERMYPVPMMAVAMAAAYGHLHILRWNGERKGDFKPMVAIAAAARGQIHILEWLEERVYLLARVKHYYSPLNTLYGLAAFFGQINTLDWFNSRKMIGAGVVGSAAAGGNIEALQWCESNGYETDGGVSGFAAGGGHLAALQWLYERGCTPDPEIAEWAALNGATHVVKWLLSNGFRYTVGVAIDTVNARHNDVLSKRDNDWTDDEWSQRLDLLQWLHDNNFALHASVYRSIVLRNDISLLEWLLSLGVTPEDDALDVAMQKSIMPVIRWLRAKGCHYNEETYALASVCRWSDNKEFLRWLMDDGCPYTDHTLETIRTLQDEMDFEREYAEFSGNESLYIT